jgi:cupin 2 domain-containing protein
MNSVQAGNIFAGIRADSHGNEDLSEILVRPGLKLERIVSRGHASPPGFWYEQAWNEWVIVLSGSAGLRFEEEAYARSLGPGDYVFIPAHKRHRVDWTGAAGSTVWLAVHFHCGEFNSPARE